VAAVDHEGRRRNQVVLGRQSVVAVVFDVAFDDDNFRVVRGQTPKELTGLWTAKTMLAVEEFNQVRHAFSLPKGVLTFCEASHSATTFLLFASVDVRTMACRRLYEDTGIPVDGRLFGRGVRNRRDARCAI